VGRVLYRREAEIDLDYIVQYIARDNLPASIAWLEETKALCQLLGSQPEIGERMVTKRFGEARRHVAGSYLIYYRVTYAGVEIVRVLHGAREHDQLI